MTMTMTMPIDYDPNLVTCGKMAKHTVRITLGMWRYRESFEVYVDGNCMGLDIVRTAVETLYEELAGDRDYALFNLHYGGESLEVVDDCEGGHDWLGKMVIALEIIRITAIDYND